MSKKRAPAPEQTDTTSAETAEPNAETTSAPIADTVRVHYTDETGDTKSLDVARGTESMAVPGGHLVMGWGETLPPTFLSATFLPTPAKPTESAGRRYVVIDVTGEDPTRIQRLVDYPNAVMIAPELPTSPRALVALIECLDVLSPIVDGLLSAAKDALARKIGTGKTVQIGGRKAYAAKMSGKARRYEWTMRYEAEREAMNLDLDLDI